MNKTKQKKLIFEKIIGVFALLSFFLAILMFIVTIFASISGEQNGKEIFGSKFLIVTSDSMSKSPTSENEEIYFNAGDLIIIKTIEDTTSFNVGDVITFVSQSPESYGETVTHKIREIKYSDLGLVTGYVTYGINTGKNDTTIVKPENIIGKYSSKIPKIGNLFSFLKTPRGYYLSILTPAVLLIIFFSIKIGKVIGKKEIEKDYNEELEELKKRVTALEERENTIVTTTVQDSGPPITITEAPISTIMPVYNAETAITEKTNENNTENALIINGKKLSFATKLLNLDDRIQDYFINLHNELVSYKKVHSRISFKCISYRFGKNLIAKITVRGKTLKLHLNLNVNDFNPNVFFQKDLSSVKVYEEVPFTVKVKSERAVNNAIKLVTALANNYGLTLKDNFLPTDVINTLKDFDKPNQETIAPPIEEPVKETNEINKNSLVIPQRKRIPFATKLLKLDDRIQNYFINLHNELVSYKKVHSRISFKCISYRFGRNLIAKITVRGKTLKLHLNLNVNDFNPNVYFQKDLSSVKAYEEVPFTVKVKSERAVNNAIKLVTALATSHELVKNTKFQKIDLNNLLKNK